MRGQQAAVGADARPLNTVETGCNEVCCAYTCRVSLHPCTIQQYLRAYLAASYPENTPRLSARDGVTSCADRSTSLVPLQSATSTVGWHSFGVRSPYCQGMGLARAPDAACRRIWPAFFSDQGRGNGRVRRPRHCLDGLFWGVTCASEASQRRHGGRLTAPVYVTKGCPSCAVALSYVKPRSRFRALYRRKVQVTHCATLAG
jgi:hypothetical protein